MPPARRPEPLIRLFPAAGRGVARVLRLAPAAAALLTVLLVLTRQIREPGWKPVAALALVVGALAWTVARRVRRAAAGLAAGVRDDLDLGSLLVGSAYAMVELLGPGVYPVVYLLMAFLVAFLPRRSGIALVGVTLLFDAAQNLGLPPREPLVFLSHAGFVSLFAALYHAVLAAQVAKGRATEKAAVDRRMRELEERARAYRLVAAGSQAGEADENRWMQASVQEVENAVGSALEIAELALDTHTSAAFMLSGDDRSLKLHDCRSTSDSVRREPFPAGEGALGGVIKRRAAVRLCGKLRGITYYESSPDVRSMLAVPIVDGGGAGTVRGVLVVDRLEARAFTDQDERLLAVIASSVLRAIEVERVMNDLKRARDEKERLFRAIDALNRASKTGEAASVALEMARGMTRLDFAALTLVEEENGRRRHRVVRVAGVSSGAALEGVDFPDNTGLVANVVRYGAPLPGRDLRQMDRPVVFDEATELRGLRSLKIVPLRAGERILGTLVAGARRKAAFDEDAVRTLEVLAMQAAQSILRANLFEQTERMATTDGLTGLFNHRTFQSRCDEAVQLAGRYQKKLSLIVCDIDHFKSVNDTYGHPAGDAVLRGVARILKRTARDSDVVARYGGEEFVVLMPETTVDGAKAIAERVRKEVQAATFDTELGPLRVTLSLGLATYPDAAKDKQGLIDLADQCLYWAKEHGRNQSATPADLESGKRKAAGTAV
jgi:two-component system cell cycle response regulator